MSSPKTDPVDWVKPLNALSFPQSALTKGGTLKLELGPEPNKSWGIGDK